MSSYRHESDYCYRTELICLWTVKISNIGSGNYENYRAINYHIKCLQLSDYRKSDRNKNVAFFQISFFFLLFLYFIVA